MVFRRRLSDNEMGCQFEGGSIAESMGSEKAEGAFSSAGANGPLLVCSQLPNLTAKLSCGRLTCLTKPSDRVTCRSVYYHEVHEGHEVIFNLTSLRVFRALRGKISFSL